MPAKVLVIEDDPDTAEIVHMYLEREGYQVSLAPDGLEGMRLANSFEPHLVVLDLMLPKVDGLELCRQIREHSKVPVIMLTARVEEEERLDGLQAGADDYVTKPFSPRELMARVKAVLRRTDPGLVDGEDQRLSIGDLVVDQRVHQVWVGGQAVHLTPTEMRLLVAFVKEPERVFTRQQLFDRIFADASDGFDRVVDSHISNLRRKLGKSQPGSPSIRAIYGVGYKLSYD